MPTPVIPWLGGKRRLAKHILPLLPDHRCYCEPFAGAAAVFFLKPPARVEVLNDINGDLVNLYRVIQHHLDEFVRQFRWSLVSRQIFSWLKDTPIETLTDIQRAARFFYLQKSCFGARATSRTFGTAPSAPPTLNLMRIEEELSEAHIRLARVYVENEPWERCIERYDRQETLFYLDPPYWQTAGYGVDFGLEQYALIAEGMRTMKGRSVVSINDHPEMRRAFAGFPVDEVKIQYTVGGGHRSAERGELIVRNW